jgi:hypothetical protein
MAPACPSNLRAPKQTTPDKNYEKIKIAKQINYLKI